MITCGIYKITSPTGRIYIGQSVNIELRKKRYKRESCKSQYKIYNSIKKYGWEAHTFEIVEECEFEQLNIRERYWQDFYDVLGEMGLNLVLQSTDIKKKVYSEELLSKMTKREKSKRWYDNKGFSEEVISQIKTNKSKRVILNTENKELYFNLKEASKKTGYSFILLFKIFSGKRENDTKLVLLEDYNQDYNYKDIIFEADRCVGKNVIDIKNGKIYTSIKKAYNDSSFKFNYRHFCKMLKGEVTNKTTFKIIT